MVRPCWGDTAPRKSTEAQLDERVPALQRWHEHVNFCMPPKAHPSAKWIAKNSASSVLIATQDACQQADGRWYPVMFN